MSDHAAHPTIVSVGYEQRSLDDLVSLLQAHDVEVLVDVRLNAISRKKGFSKTALADGLGNAGIRYRHERSLGNPQDNREPFRQGQASARRRYEGHLRNGASATYDDVVNLAKQARIALFCYERDHDSCHRSCIVDAALIDEPDLSILRL